MPAGAPTKYNPKLLKLIEILCETGMTDVELTEALTDLGNPVCPATIYNWQNEHPELLETMKTAKRNADKNMEKSLYHRGRGYKHPETKVFCNNGVIITHEVTKYYPPDTAAAFIWLKNRAGWQDRHEVAHRHTFEEGVDKQRELMEASGEVPGDDHEPLNINCECPYCRIRRGEVKQVEGSVNVVK